MPVVSVGDSHDESVNHTFYHAQPPSSYSISSLYRNCQVCIAMPVGRNTQSTACTRFELVISSVTGRRGLRAPPTGQKGWTCKSSRCGKRSLFNRQLPLPFGHKRLRVQWESNPQFVCNASTGWSHVQPNGHNESRTRAFASTGRCASVTLYDQGILLYLTLFNCQTTRALGLEPRTTVLETVMMPISPYS